MGVSYTSYLMVGVRLSSILKIEQVVEDQVRYDMDTGQPYKVAVSRWRATLFLREVKIDEDTYPEDWSELLGLPHGYKIQDTGDTSRHWSKEGMGKWNLDRFVFGKLLCEADIDDPVHSIHPGSLKTIRDDLSQALSDLAGKRIEAELFLLHAVYC